MVSKAICFGILQKSAPCLHVTKAAKQWRIVEIEFLATLGWKCSCQPFSCQCSLKVTADRRFVRHACQRESMPFVKSKPPLPTRSLRFLRAAVRSSSSALWLDHVHPFVAAEEKRTCPMQRSRGFGLGVVVSKNCYILCSYVTAN